MKFSQAILIACIGGATLATAVSPVRLAVVPHAVERRSVGPHKFYGGTKVSGPVQRITMPSPHPYHGNRVPSPRPLHGNRITMPSPHPYHGNRVPSPRPNAGNRVPPPRPLHGNRIAMPSPHPYHGNGAPSPRPNAGNRIAMPSPQVVGRPDRFYRPPTQQPRTGHSRSSAIPRPTHAYPRVSGRVKRDIGGNYEGLDTRDFELEQLD